MGQRHLTPAEKAKHMAYWASARADFEKERPTLDFDPAGRGYPDPEVYALTDRLNAIGGVCTVQSCSGHQTDILVTADPNADAPITEESLWSAQLWLRLSEPMTRLFLVHAPSLAKERPAIERVRLIFSPEGDVADITFQGLNVSGYALAQASDIIVAFFRRLEAAASLQHAIDQVREGKTLTHEEVFGHPPLDAEGIPLDSAKGKADYRAPTEQK